MCKIYINDTQLNYLYMSETISTQLINIDKILLPIFGFSSIIDYSNVLIYNNISKDVINKINKNIDTILDGFKLRHFNLYKTNGKITTTNQAFNLLKICLSDTHIPFEIFNKKIKGKVNKCMRLLPIEKIVYTYILKMEAEICTPKKETQDRDKKIIEIKYSNEDVLKFDTHRCLITGCENNAGYFENNSFECDCCDKLVRWCYNHKINCKNNRIEHAIFLSWYQTMYDIIIEFPTVVKNLSISLKYFGNIKDLQYECISQNKYKITNFTMEKQLLVLHMFYERKLIIQYDGVEPQQLKITGNIADYKKFGEIVSKYKLSENIMIFNIGDINNPIDTNWENDSRQLV